MTALKLRRVCAGVYETPNGQHRILRTDGWEGPRRGQLSRWELAVPDEYHGWVVDSTIFCRTKREATTELQAFLCSKAGEA